MPGDSVFMITGAAGGIGAATARLAAAAGYRLVLTGRRAGPLGELAREIGGPERVLASPCDVSAWDQIQGLVRRAEEVFGRLDVAFANAGLSVPTSFLGTDGGPPGQWREMVLTNVLGTALTARAALPALVSSRGHLLLTGSVAGRVMRPGNLYSATKWAVTALGQSIRAECAGTGVRVTVIQPGLTDSGAISPARRADPKLEPADVARAVMYATGQPPGVDVSEIVIRPTGQNPHI
jgi:NADP-dependent 3-hydroxy acid dehydrogenase YdfG